MGEHGWTNSWGSYGIKGEFRGIGWHIPWDLNGKTTMEIYGELSKMRISQRFHWIHIQKNPIWELTSFCYCLYSLQSWFLRKSMLSHCCWAVRCLSAERTLWGQRDDARRVSKTFRFYFRRPASLLALVQTKDFKVVQINTKTTESSTIIHKSHQNTGWMHLFHSWNWRPGDDSPKPSALQWRKRTWGHHVIIPNLPGLVNVNKKLWKITMLLMGKATISTGSFSIVILT